MHTIDLTIAKYGLPAVAGLPTGYVPGVLLREAELLTALADYEADIEAWVQCGGYKSSTAPITELDAATASERIWTADNNDMTRASDSGVMGGRKRWLSTGHATEGLRGTLASTPDTWDGYTIIFPDFEPTSLAANNCLFSVGVTAASRLTLYLTLSNGRINLNNGVGGNTISQASGSNAVGTVSTYMATYNASDGATALYVNSTTAVGTGTLTQGPGASALAGILGSADDAVDSAAYASQCIVIRQAITDAGDIAAIMAACERIRGYPA